MKKKQKSCCDWAMWLWLIGSSIFVILLWRWIGFVPVNSQDTLANAGAYGDSFGYVNSLFSGLALAGVVVAILLQRRDLKVQSETLEASLNEMKQSVKAAEQHVAEAEQVRKLTAEQKEINDRMLDIEIGRSRPRLNLYVQTNTPERSDDDHLYLSAMRGTGRFLAACVENDESRRYSPDEPIEFGNNNTACVKLFFREEYYTIRIYYTLQIGLIDSRLFQVRGPERKIVDLYYQSKQQEVLEQIIKRESKPNK